jgi:hypothetical protein
MQWGGHARTKRSRTFFASYAGLSTLRGCGERGETSQSDLRTCTPERRSLHHGECSSFDG